LSIKAHQHLQEAYPGLAGFFEALGPIEMPQPRQSVGEAVVRTVVGQMLSRAAARAIYQRLVAECGTYGLPGTWCLNEDKLQTCGLSARKRRTITEFAVIYTSNQPRIEAWKELETEALIEEVRSFWGMSDWTGAMLAIFQFSHRDLFPWNDGSIIRVVELVKARFYEREPFEPDRAAPYRTFLALYFWKSLDEAYWSLSEQKL